MPWSGALARLQENPPVKEPAHSQMTPALPDHRSALYSRTESLLRRQASGRRRAALDARAFAQLASASACASLFPAHAIAAGAGAETCRLSTGTGRASLYVKHTIVVGASAQAQHRHGMAWQPRGGLAGRVPRQRGQCQGARNTTAEGTGPPPSRGRAREHRGLQPAGGPKERGAPEGRGRRGTVLGW